MWKVESETSEKLMTIQDYVVWKVGPKDEYSGLDYETAEMPVFGGCEVCAASLAGYNAYPAVTGYLRCAHDIGDLGFGSPAEFDEWLGEAT